jgi:hypothetical protein
MDPTGRREAAPDDKLREIRDFAASVAFPDCAGGNAVAAGTQPQSAGLSVSVSIAAPALGVSSGLRPLVGLRDSSDCFRWKFLDPVTAWDGPHAVMRSWSCLRSRKLTCPTECQRPSRRFPEFPSCFKLSDAPQLVLNALSGSSENRLAPICVLCRSGETLAAGVGRSLCFAASMPRQCTLPVTQIPKAGAKALKSFALHLSNHWMVRIQYDFALVGVQKAELRPAWN